MGSVAPACTRPFASGANEQVFLHSCKFLKFERVNLTMTIATHAPSPAGHRSTGLRHTWAAGQAAPLVLEPFPFGIDRASASVVIVSLLLWTEGKQE